MWLASMSDYWLTFWFHFHCQKEVLWWVILWSTIELMTTCAFEENIFNKDWHSSWKLVHERSFLYVWFQCFAAYSMLDRCKKCKEAVCLPTDRNDGVGGISWSIWKRTCSSLPVSESALITTLKFRSSGTTFGLQSNIFQDLTQCLVSCSPAM